jgi:hypothetical protein
MSCGRASGPLLGSRACWAEPSWESSNRPGSCSSCGRRGSAAAGGCLCRDGAGRTLPDGGLVSRGPHRGPPQRFRSALARRDWSPTRTPGPISLRRETCASTMSSTVSRNGVDPRCGLARIGGMRCEIRQRRAQGRARSRVWLRGRTYAATALLKGRASAAPPPRSPHRRRR